MLIKRNILKRIYKPIVTAVFVVVIIIGGAMFSLPILKDEAVKTHLKITDFHTKALTDLITQTFNNLSYTMDNFNSILKTTQDIHLLNNKFKSILSTTPSLGLLVF